MTGGILTIISGIFSVFLIIGGIFYTSMPGLIESDTSFGKYPQVPEVAMTFVIIMGIALIIFGLVTGTLAIGGGIWALKRKCWALSLTGAICANLVFWPIGIPAVILISLARPEFIHQGQPSDPLRNETPIQLA